MTRRELDTLPRQHSDRPPDAAEVEANNTARLEAIREIFNESDSMLRTHNEIKGLLGRIRDLVFGP